MMIPVRSMHRDKPRIKDAAKAADDSLEPLSRPVIGGSLALEEGRTNQTTVSPF